jgi:ketosteroid isomerase-like protein
MGSQDVAILEVQAVLRRWRESVNAGNADDLLELVADELEMIPPGEEPLKGAAAHQFLRGFTDDGVANLELFRDEEIVASGDWAFQRYSYELKMTPKDGSDPMTIPGHGIHMFCRQDDGSWNIQKDVWNVVPSS